MDWRVKEFSEILPDAAWLPEADAGAVYDRVAPLLSRDGYGLDANAIKDFQRFPAEPAATDYLRLASGLSDPRFGFP